MNIQELQELLKNNSIQMKNPYLNEIIAKFSIHVITQDYIQKIQQKNKKSIIIFDEIKVGEIKCSFFVICFDYSIFIIQSSDILLLSSFFSNNNDSTIYYYTKGIKKKIPNYQKSQLHFKKLTDNKNQSFLSNFFNKCKLKYDRNTKKIQELLWKIVGKTILAFLIQNSFLNSLNDKINKRDAIFTKNINEIEIKNDEYIDLGLLTIGSSSFLNVVYLIKNERICILKMFSNEEEKNLFKREHENYLNLNHPFIPQYFGTTEKNQAKSLFIEYFDGETLDNLKMDELSIQNKIKILFDIMITIEYFHVNKYIYRDLKPNNVIVDENNTPYIIDFDRMVKFTDENEFYSIPERTQNFFNSEYYSPELTSGRPVSNKTDIYSLGKLISIFKFENESKEYKNEVEKLHETELKCNKLIENERPSISEIIDEFYFNIYLKINKIFETDDLNTISKYHGEFYSKYWYYIAESQNPEYQIKLALLYKDGFYIYKAHNQIRYCVKDTFDQNKKCTEIIFIPQNINKTIYYFSLASNQNHPNAQYNLGLIYYDGKYINQDINKAIQYFSLAANQNISNAQYLLALIFFKGKKYYLDINKAFYFFSLAAKQNHIGACYDLGSIYYLGIHVKQDIDKSIYYYTIAADQNFVSAQFDLGFIYLQKNITKSIYYLTLAANQSHCIAQFILGILYFNGDYVSHDINKAIFYFNLASKQNQREATDILEIIHSDLKKSQVKNVVQLFFKSVNQNAKAQYSIGCFYYEDKNPLFNIKKALYYFSLASDNNNSEAQYAIGTIYYEGKYVNFNINKSLHYFQLASNQNNTEAQYAMGVIYHEGKYVKCDINKAIYYYKLAADQNFLKAQYELGYIYYKGLYVNREINKAIHYFSLAAAQNNTEAQFMLGLIFLKGTFVPCNIKEAIHYFTLSANQNHTQSQYNLGVIYSTGLYTNPDVHKAIHYYSLAAEKKHREALYNLGVIYYNGKLITKDIKKSIFYLQAAADLNHINAQYTIGCIYYFGKYGAIDYNKAIHYFTLAADQNHKDSQFYLGRIYSNGEYIERNINKAIKYYTQAANNNDKMAQNNLGILFIDGKYVKRDANKAIHYFTLSANLNSAESQYTLGMIYEKGEYVPQDINKSIYYYSLAAKQNDKDALYRLGFLYFFKLNNHENNIIKSIKYFELSAQSNHITSNFFVGYFYHEGKYVKRDIKKAIHYYKEASSFNNEYSKNNLGILYKHGFGEELKQSLGSAIIYFEEAIKIQNNFTIPIYNLAHLYFYNIENEIDKAIHLLIMSSSLSCSHSKKLLCIALVKKIGFHIDLIQKEIEKENKIELAKEICAQIINMKLSNLSKYEKIYECYRNIDFVVGVNDDLLSKDLMNIDQYHAYSNNSKINRLFYEGFGFDI